jgi:hypothetical protein
MTKIERTHVDNIVRAVYGARNAMNSWDKADSDLESNTLGEKDLELALKLAKGGSVHAKYRRMITVTVDITAPLYWWTEYDTYKVGTVANSCSKMHKLLHKPFEMSDFSFDKLPGYKREIKQFRKRELAQKHGVSHTCICDIINDKYKYAETTNLYEEVARPIVDMLNELRDSYFNSENEDEKKIIWYSILQLLPESYNQKRTVLLNYEVLCNMYHARKNHKLDEWVEFCEWIETLPYSEIITGTEK